MQEINLRAMALEAKFIKEEKVVINNIITIKQLIEKFKTYNKNITESKESISDDEEENDINFFELRGDHHHHKPQFKISADRDKRFNYLPLANEGHTENNNNQIHHHTDNNNNQIHEDEAIEQTHEREETELEKFNRSFHKRHGQHLKEIEALDKEFEELKLLRNNKKHQKKRKKAKA